MLSYIEISKENLLNNFRLMKSLVKPETKIVSVIKANAYGHGQNEVARILEDASDYFQVDDAEELKLLRKVSKKTTFVFGYVAQDEIAEVLKLDGIIGVYSKEQILAIDSAAKILGKKAVVHVKIDAALGRQGVLLNDVPEFIDKLKKCGNILVDGIYSHFANIEDTTDFSHAQKQLDLFSAAVDMFKKNGYANIKTHMSASSGVMMYEKNNENFSLVRPGISLYGLWPSEDLRKKLESKNFKLEPVLRWVTHVAQIKTVPKNYSIGYGLTYITSKPTKIAVIPQGYSDGYDRGLSNIGEVLIQGKRCPVLGRVAMNMFIVDVSHLNNVKVEDEAVLLGSQGGEKISAEEIATRLGTINYEVIARISSGIPRIVV
jgi:alanine racemase